MKKYISIALSIVAVLTIPFFDVRADQAATTTVFIRIETATTTLWNSEIEVSACSPTGTGTNTLTGYCAVIDTGLNNSWTTYGDDYFLESINGAANDFGTNAYWSWFINESYGQTALTGHTLISGEHLLLTLGIMPLKIEVSTTSVTVFEFGFDSSWNGVWTPSASSTIYSGQDIFCTTPENGLCSIAESDLPRVFFATKSGFATSSSKTLAARIATSTPTSTVTPETTAATSGSGGSSLITNTQTKTVDISKALNFLSVKQQNDGSFGGGLYTDWAAIALATGPNNTNRNALSTFMRSGTPNLSSITDYERHAMALMALGINPYSGTEINCISPIVSSFDGTQIGDVNLINDDIFALFPLLKSGYSVNDVIINSTTLHIISTQKENGSWNDSVDMTAAAIQALSQVRTVSGASDALQKARAYIIGKQVSDGGFGSVFSTSWVIQAFNSLGEYPADIKNSSGKSPLDSLAEIQAPDGGFEVDGSNSTRIWSTSYAIPAILNRTWSSLLSSFSKPQKSTVQVSQSNTVSTTTLITQISATTTIPVKIAATTPLTPIIAPVPEPTIKKPIPIPVPPEQNKTVLKMKNTPPTVVAIENNIKTAEVSLAAVAASKPTKTTDILLKTALSIVTLSGFSFLFVKII